jgi:hypothetical protein
MKVLKLGRGIEVHRCECTGCKSLLSYTDYDIRVWRSDWIRTGIERSMCHADEHIICPVCNTRIVLKEWVEEYG